MSLPQEANKVSLPKQWLEAGGASYTGKGTEHLLFGNTYFWKCLNQLVPCVVPMEFPGYLNASAPGQVSAGGWLPAGGTAVSRGMEGDK